MSQQYSAAWPVRYTGIHLSVTWDGPALDCVSLLVTRFNRVNTIASTLPGFMWEYGHSEGMRTAEFMPPPRERLWSCKKPMRERRLSV